MKTPEQQLVHDLRAPIHTYAVPVSPKMLRETLCVVESALTALERERPGFNAGGTVDAHRHRIALLIEECDRKRPLGPNGKHDSRHTDECGCRPQPGEVHAR